MASQNLLMETTGGWTFLLDEAAQLTASDRSARRVCETNTAKLASGEFATKLVDQVGIAAIPGLEAAFEVLVSYNEPMTSEDMVALFEAADCGGARSEDMLRYLDVVVERSVDGLWEPEPVFAAAWKTVQGQ